MTNIEQRTDSELEIVRVGAENIIVPITARSIRKVMLMQEDYITLDFSLDEAVHFAIGDYVNDPIFGKFTITEEQMPRYNQQTGGYDYTLRFDADYMVWKNWIHCLIANNKRMESQWSLTDRLETHAQLICDSVNNVLGITPTANTDPETGTTTYTSRGYGYSITAANAAEVKFLSYDGTDIISALNLIAEAWNCEWWVTHESVRIGNTTYYNTIHFGKCENEVSATKLEQNAFRLGDSVESMDVSRDQQTYATRLFAFGGTKNVPETYDRKLEFEIDKQTGSQSSASYEDTTRPLTLAMVEGVETITNKYMTLGNGNSSIEEVGGRYVNTITYDSNSVSVNGVASLDFTGRCSIIANHQVMVTAKAALYDGEDKVKDLSGNLSSAMNGANTTHVWRVTEEPMEVTPNGALSVRFEWVLRASLESMVTGSVGMVDGLSVKVNAEYIDGDAQITVTYNGVDYAATLHGSTGRFTFNGSKPNWVLVNAQNKKKVTISPLNLNVPISYYKRTYDAGVLKTIGERRIHLPLADYPNRYYPATSPRTATQEVEKVVIFEDVYPRLELVISEVQENKLRDTIEHEDKSVTYEDWTQYLFKVTKADGTDFNFDTDYLMDGNRLEAVFTAPQTMQPNGFMLSGMTFVVDYDNAGWYTIIRNEDYGANLPNEVLKPSVGDTLFLTGWNPQAMRSLGMIDAAEEELESKVSEYYNALQQGQFTLTCRMMSDIWFSYDWGGSNPQGGGLRRYGLLDLGTQVKVYHAALPGGTKTSRIIGCEYKLDMPFDSPTYIIGETEAYSRLKQIEKQLTKL
jgi:hypothetical protein